MTVWLDGLLLTDAEATVSVFDHGLVAGDGVFEMVRVYDGRPFALRRHLGRLARSCAGMGLEAPSDEMLRTAVALVIEANGLGDGVTRITVTGGPGPLASSRGRAPPTVIVATGPGRAGPATADVIVVPWARNERSAVAGLKTTSYAENVVALAYAQGKGADEAIFPNCADNLCEGTGTNVFLALDGRLVTPPLSAGCLAGVTRDLLVEAAVAEELDVPISALARADEAFLTSSTREVQPVRAVDGNRLPSCPGALTKAAAEAWQSILAAGIDP